MAKVRISFLSLVFGSVFCVLVRTILTPAATKTTATPFVFPTAVPLPEWQMKKSNPLAAPSERSNYLSGRHYQYAQNDLTLDIQMRYVVNTKGDVNSFIQDYSSVPLSPGELKLVLRQQQGIGFYSLFTDQKRAYLSSCINPRGGSTVTNEQFRRNRYTYENLNNIWFQERLIPWLQGRGSIRDMRCLWAHLSIPVKHNSSEDTYRILEKAWFSWYQWWQLRFPQP